MYFWFPNTIFTALSIFNWISWIAPGNVRLNSVVGFNNGVGVCGSFFCCCCLWVRGLMLLFYLVEPGSDIRLAEYSA